MATIEARASKRMANAAERVFDAWLDPNMIGNFMLGPHLRDEQIVRLEHELRVGGTFSFFVNRASCTSARRVSLPCDTSARAGR